jgi:hypothetical protein
MSKEHENPEDFELDENGIPKDFIRWLTKVYGAHPLLAPTLWVTGKLPKPKWFIEREKEKEKRFGIS